jgi:hypothetical protein
MSVYVNVSSISCTRDSACEYQCVRDMRRISRTEDYNRNEILNVNVNV